MHLQPWILSSLCVFASFEATAAEEPKGDAKLEFEQIVWVQNKAPQISLLYVLVPDVAKDLDGVNKLVLGYAPLALREAEKLTGLDERKLPRFKGAFNVVFVVRQGKGEKHALATAFSAEQLKEYLSAPQERALKTIGRHAWGHQKLPLINSGP